jgi:hypothetical protein
MSAQEIFSFQISGDVAWRWCVRNITLPQRTPHFLKTTPSAFFFSPLAVTRDILATSQSLTETDQALLSAVRGCVLAPLFPYICHEEESRAFACLFLCPAMKE